MTVSRQLLVLALCLAAPAARSADTDTVQEYAAKCDMAIGITVPDFNCDSGTEVPVTHLTNDGFCDRPNVLNSECDPGSHFQVLTKNETAYAVAHCRKMRNPDGKYGDIAVIQHNRATGATCFYQALQVLDANGDPLDGNVQAPSKQTPSEGGMRKFWMTPAEIASPAFLAPCGMCHDNGPIIRSPYLTQLATEPNVLPGAGDAGFNSKGQPYYFVGTDFAPWKAYTVEVKDNQCKDCHRLGVNNLVRIDSRNGRVIIGGTARDLAIRATDKTQENPFNQKKAKNPHSPDSPMWMLLGQTDFDQDVFNAATEIKTCGDRFTPDSPLPNDPTCTITQFTGPPGAPPALTLGGELASDPAVEMNQDGRLEAFALGPDHALWHIWQASPNGGWSDWSPLGGNLAGFPVVGANLDGRLEVFIRGSDNALWHVWQLSPNGGWSGWLSMGGQLTSEPAVGSNSDGRLEVFARGSDNALWHLWQSSPNGEWANWQSLGGELTSDPAVARNADGRLEAFARQIDNALWHIWQTDPNGGWSQWSSLGGTPSSDFVVGSNADGRLEVFAGGTDRALWHIWQLSPNGDWSGWDPGGGELASKPAVGRNDDGGLEVFVRGTDLALWHRRQNGSQWSPWYSLGGQLPGNVVVTRNNAGRPVVFVRGTDNALWHN